MLKNNSSKIIYCTWLFVLNHCQFNHLVFVLLYKHEHFQKISVLKYFTQLTNEMQIAKAPFLPCSTPTQTLQIWDLVPNAGLWNQFVDLIKIFMNKNALHLPSVHRNIVDCWTWTVSKGKNKFNISFIFKTATNCSNVSVSVMPNT